MFHDFFRIPAPQIHKILGSKSQSIRGSALSSALYLIIISINLFLLNKAQQPDFAFLDLDLDLDLDRFLKVKSKAIAPH
jgi:hypothetical protein